MRFLEGDSCLVVDYRSCRQKKTRSHFRRRRSTLPTRYRELVLFAKAKYDVLIKLFSKTEEAAETKGTKKQGAKQHMNEPP